MILKRWGVNFDGSFDGVIYRHSLTSKPDWKCEFLSTYNNSFSALSHEVSSFCDKWRFVHWKSKIFWSQNYFTNHKWKIKRFLKLIKCQCFAIYTFTAYTVINQNWMVAPRFFSDAIKIKFLSLKFRAVMCDRVDGATNWKNMLKSIFDAKLELFKIISRALIVLNLPL